MDNYWDLNNIDPERSINSWINREIKVTEQTSTCSSLISNKVKYITDRSIVTLTMSLCKDILP